MESVNQFSVGDKVVIVKLREITASKNYGWLGYYERGQLREGVEGKVKQVVSIYGKYAYLIELKTAPDTTFCLQEDEIVKKAEVAVGNIKDNLDFVKHVVKISRYCGVRDKLDIRICRECEHFEGYCHFPWWIEYTFEALLKMYSKDESNE